jgi:hypothetical protein
LTPTAYADRVVQLLAQEPVRGYLATVLASFTRVESVTVLTELRPGTWRAYRTNELNVEGMMRYSQTLDEAFRFAPYKRIGDVCLFLTGVFPEYGTRVGKERGVGGGTDNAIRELHPGQKAAGICGKPLPAVCQTHLVQVVTGTHDSITGMNDTQIEEAHMQALAEQLRASIDGVLTQA